MSRASVLPLARLARTTERSRPSPARPVISVCVRSVIFGRSLDPLDQIVGHGGGEIGRAHDDVDMRGLLGEEHRRLTRRIAAADDDHLLAAAQRRLHGGRGVMNASAFEPFVIGDGELAVARAGGDDEALCAHFRAPFEAQNKGRFRAVDRGRLARDRELGAEFLRLHLGPAGQRLARDAGRKAEIIFDFWSWFPPARPAPRPRSPACRGPRRRRRPRRRARRVPRRPRRRQRPARGRSPR